MRYLIHLCLGVTFLFVSGCEAKKSTTSGTDNHNHADHSAANHPETFKDIFTTTLSTSEKIRDAVKEGKLDVAHEELHPVGHLLADLEESIKKSDLDTAVKTDMENKRKALFDVLMTIDGDIHDKKEVKYESIKEKIEPAIDELKKLSDKVK